jgi:hypothetical protein
MKHLKKFNEDSDNTLEPQDLLDFSQDLVDNGYKVRYLSNMVVITPDDIINNNEVIEKFNFNKNKFFKIEISEFSITDFQKVFNYMESFKRHIFEYSFILDDFKITGVVLEDEKYGTPIIKSISYHFLKSDIIGD